jgi:hypothetical protein
MCPHTRCRFGVTQCRTAGQSGDRSPHSIYARNHGTLCSKSLLDLTPFPAQVPYNGRRSVRQDFLAKGTGTICRAAARRVLRTNGACPPPLARKSCRTHGGGRTDEGGRKYGDESSLHFPMFAFRLPPPLLMPPVSPVTARAWENWPRACLSSGFHSRNRPRALIRWSWKRGQVEHHGETESTEPAIYNCQFAIAFSVPPCLRGEIPRIVSGSASMIHLF